MHELGRNCSVLVLLLGASFVLSGCKEAPLSAKAGPPFSAESAAPTKSVIYVYWPREMRGRMSQLLVGPCGELGQEKTVLRGGYAPFVVDPGPSCFQAWASWDLLHAQGQESSIDSSAVEDLGKLETRSEPGRSAFLRVEPRKGVLDYHNVLRQMAPAAAGPEIKQCRRSMPLELEEITPRG